MTDRPLYAQLDLKRHGFIEASAGTGKTFTLEHLIYRILTEEQDKGKETYLDLDKIVVLTFTEKAVGEIRARVRNIIQLKLIDFSRNYPAFIIPRRIPFRHNDLISQKDRQFIV